MKIKRVVSVITALLMLTVLIFSIQSYATNQPNSRISPISLSNDMNITKLVWNENTYSYAIGIGRNTSSNKAAIFRYEPEKGWKEIYEESNTYYTYYDVAYDTYTNNDTFIVVGYGDGESIEMLVYNANGNNPTVNYLGEPPPGDGYTAVCFDKYTGSQGTIVAVGTPHTSSQGIIAWNILDNSGGIFRNIYLKSGINLKDVTTNYDPSNPLIIAVGYDYNENRTVAYVCDYYKVYALNVPPDAAELNTVQWVPDNAGGYALVAGKDASGHGKIWKLDNLHQVFHISYYNRTSGHESLKYAFYDGYRWRITTVDASQYAGYYTSIALDSHGRPHISYYDGGASCLKHAYFKAGSWHIETVDSNGNVGQYSSIAIDTQDHIHISYFDNTNKHLKYAYYDGSWHIETADGSNQVGWDTSIAVDSRGNPHISYYDFKNGYLKYAVKTGGSWNTETVDSTNDAGRYSSIVVDEQDRPHISYSDGGAESLKYASKGYSSWTIETAASGTSQYTSLALDRADEPHISYINGGLKYIDKSSGSWSTPTAIDSHANSYTSMKLGLKDIPFISYYDSAAKDLKFAWYDYGSNSWKKMLVDSYGDVGDYSSLAIGMRGHYVPLKISSNAPDLRDIAWKNDGSMAVVVGDSGSVFVYYDGSDYAYDWSDSSVVSAGLTGVAVKPPGSPGYALAVGNGKSVKISYQMYNTGTTVSAKAIKPHISEINITDSSGNCLLNHQIDVESKVTFFIKGYYEKGWDQVGGIDIYAWYDQGSESTQYNQTKGANINFHLHYTPDYSNPSQGTWKLLWPNKGELTLLDWYQTTSGDGNSAELYVNISFGPQIRYSPGNGWHNSSNQSSPTSSFNDKNSWNFNATIYDVSNPNTKDVKYDEFGVYAYTEIIVTNNPSGSGAPGETIDLSPPSHLGVRANRNYTVTVSIGDLENATGARKITEDNVMIKNLEAHGNTTLSDIADWTNFPSSGGALSVWGSGGHLIDPVDYGTCSVGVSYGYDIGTSYTTVLWRITIPPSTPEDEYRTVITFEITY